MSSRPKIPLSRREVGVAFALSLAICILLQFYAGAFSTDLSAHPDEPAHAVTGLMIRDYIAGGLIDNANPMSYARDYYERFPKVALGHYPPAFYILEALVLVPFRSIAACVTLIALLAAAWMTLTVVCVRLAYPAMAPRWAWLPAAVIPLIPMVGTSLVMVMSDLLLALLCLGATIAFSKFVEKPSAKFALLFGVLAAAAGLTKASGLLLALVPPITCVLAGRWKLLLTPKLWLAPVPVVFTVIPWLMATRHITQEGMLEIPLGEFVGSAVRFYAATLVDEVGFATLALAAVSLSVFAYRFIKSRSPLPPILASLGALLIATLFFYSCIPAGLEPRYLLPLIPSVAVLSAGGILLLVSKLSNPVAKIALASALTVFATYGFYSLPEHVGSGYGRVSAHLVSNSAEPTTILVSSDAVGEGAVIATAAFSIRPSAFGSWKFLRSTKVLSQSDWMGRSYQASVSTPDELASLLDSEGVTILLEDTSIPDRLRLPHNALLEVYLSQFAAEDEHRIPVVRTGHSDRLGKGEVIIATVGKHPATTK